MKITGSQAIAKSLQAQGVDTLFGYPGGAIMPTYDALYDVQKTLRHILARHEQGAIHAAEGYARVSGKPGVCIATSGPGATNLVTGIADAMLDCVPIVCITGQVASDFLGTDAFQEADIIGITIPITKWNYQITDAAEIPEMIAKAFYIATHGKPGPVLLDITKDAQFGEIDYLEKSYTFDYYCSQTQTPSNQFIDAAARINQAKQPLIFAGNGIAIAHAQTELAILAERADIPVATTLHGLSALPNKHSHHVGLLGMHGNYATNRLSNDADVIIALGMRFDDRVTGSLDNYLKKAQIIHIDIDAGELNKNVPVDVAIQADLKQALQAILPHIESNKHPNWRAQFTQLWAVEQEQVIAPQTQASEGPIKMAEVIANLSEQTAGQALLVTDVGQHQMIAARYYNFELPYSHISSGGLGTMGFALPAAIGAQLAAPNRSVIVIVGDGGIQMNIQELAVIAQEQLPIKIIILNNSFLGMVRQWQEMFFDKRYSFTQLQNPDFVAIAKAYGLPGQRIDEREQLSSALQTLIEQPGAYVLEVAVEQENNVFPMVPSGASVRDVRLA